MIFESLADSPFARAQAVKQVRPDTDWHVSEHEEGKLAVDILETEHDILVISTMAGAETSRIEVFVQDDLLTIRGYRPRPTLPVGKAEYIHQECFWGSFSRSIVLPSEVKGDLARAEYKNGLLQIRVPKRETGSQIPITIVEE